MTTSNYQWAKIELLGHRVRYGRCSVVEFLGTQMLRIEVPFAEPKIEQRSAAKYEADRFVNVPLGTLIEMCTKEFGDCEKNPVPWELVNRLCDVRENVTVEQFASVEEYAPAALYGRTILTEAEVRKALEPWKPEPLPALPYRTAATRGEDWEDSAPLDVDQPAAMSVETGREWLRSIDDEVAGRAIENRLAKIASANWAEYDPPGWRIISLASVGFRGVGRPDAAKQCDEDADYFKTDAEAMRYLAGFQWNELADLPFLTRDLLGIDEHGNWVDADEDGECPWLVDPLPGQGVSKAMAEVFTPEGEREAGALGVTVIRETERPAKPLYKATTCDNGETWSYEFPDVGGDVLCVSWPKGTGGIAEFSVVIDDLWLDIWCPNTAQLEALYDRIEEILKAELLKQGRTKTDFTVVFRETVEWSNGAIGWFDERTKEWNIVKDSSDTRDHFAMLDEIYKRAAKEPQFIELEGKSPFDMSEGYETTQEKVDEAVARNTVNVMQRGTVILENGNKATLHDGAITEHGNDGPVRPKYTREWLINQPSVDLRELYEKEFSKSSDKLTYIDVLEWLSRLKEGSSNAEVLAEKAR